MAVKVANMKTTHLKGNWSVPLAAQAIRNSAAPIPAVAMQIVADAFLKHAHLNAID
jgi:hypothetical protein